MAGENVARGWMSGRPTHVGWWESSPNLRAGSWRWWNGACWSMPCVPGMGSAEVAFRASVADPMDQSKIRWNEYWPPNALTRRENPDANQARSIVYDSVVDVEFDRVTVKQDGRVIVSRMYRGDKVVGARYTPGNLGAGDELSITGIRGLVKPGFA